MVCAVQTNQTVSIGVAWISAPPPCELSPPEIAAFQATATRNGRVIVPRPRFSSEWHSAGRSEPLFGSEWRWTWPCTVGRSPSQLVDRVRRRLGD